VEINAGFSIQREDPTSKKWEQAIFADEVAPCNNILNSYFEQIRGSLSIKMQYIKNIIF